MIRPLTSLACVLVLAGCSQRLDRDTRSAVARVGEDHTLRRFAQRKRSDLHAKCTNLFFSDTWVGDLMKF